MKIPPRLLRLLIAPVLATLFSNAHAGWAEIERFDDNTRIYVDKKTAQREGDIAQIMHLVRWGEPQADPGLPPYRSTVVRTAYDCARKHEKYLASTSFAGPMGDGAQIVADEDAAETWDSISDDSMEEKLWKAACGRS